MFFIGVVIIWVILYIFSWFFSSVSEDDRAFEVTISGAGESVTVDSESLQFNQRETYEIVAKRDIPPIDLVNRSGVNGAAANIGFALEELGYTIDSVSTELNIADGQTVIVYNPELEDEALELSAVLDNALLSAFVPENNQEFTIIVYVGSDISN